MKIKDFNGKVKPVGFEITDCKSYDDGDCYTYCRKTQCKNVVNCSYYTAKKKKHINS